MSIVRILHAKRPAPPYRPAFPMPKPHPATLADRAGFWAAIARVSQHDNPYGPGHQFDPLLRRAWNAGWLRVDDLRKKSIQQEETAR